MPATSAAPCKHLGAIILAPGLWSADGRRSVPPAERPTADVAAEKKRERPRLRRANAAPRPSTGSLTPLVSVLIMVTGAGIVQAEIVPAIRPPK